jgi:hypothetical protein
LPQDKDPETWIRNLEELHLKLEVVGSRMTNEQLMLQILNNLAIDYELQMRQSRLESYHKMESFYGNHDKDKKN